MTGAIVDWNAGEQQCRDKNRPARNGNSSAARLRRKVVRDLLAELGVQKLSELAASEQMTVSRLATAHVEAEALVLSKIRGDAVPTEDVVRGTNALGRALEAFQALKAQRTAQSKPSTADWLAALTSPRPEQTPASDAHNADTSDA